MPKVFEDCKSQITIKVAIINEENYWSQIQSLNLGDKLAHNLL